METIDYIIYLGRVRSAIEDMPVLHEHGFAHEAGAASAALEALHDKLLATIKAAPDHERWVKFNEEVASDGSPAQPLQGEAQATLDLNEAFAVEEKHNA